MVLWSIQPLSEMSIGAGRGERDIATQWAGTHWAVLAADNTLTLWRNGI
jgi:hypothetical protein